MAVLQVSPTRMELSRLKKRLTSSMRGHKLLKDKRDDMMKRFLELARKNMELRLRLEEKMEEIYAGFTMAAAVMGNAAFQEALMLPQTRVYADVETKNVMGISVPEFSFKGDTSGNIGSDKKKDIYPYGFAFTSAGMDASMDALLEILPLLLQLAQTEKLAALLAEEIEKTRRRVNALEYIQIPTLQDTIKSITTKLDERERSNLARLMKVKDMAVAQQRATEK